MTLTPFALISAVFNGLADVHLHDTYVTVRPAFRWSDIPFPQINAALNGASGVLLLAGYVCIKCKAVRAHTAFMLSAVGSSTLFLVSYLTYHFTVHGLTKFPEGPWRTTYLWILGTHTVLAVVVVPLVGITLLRAYRRQWERHKKIARITFPIWLYVSVTGVVIYWMLYHLKQHL